MELTAENVCRYLGRECAVKPLGGGVSNTVLLIENGTERMVLKQSLGKLRVEQDWFSERDRIFREAAALRMLARVLPDGAIPRLISEDRENYAMVMSAAPPGARTWKSLLLEGIARPEIARRIALLQAAMIRASCHAGEFEHASEFERTFGDQTVFDQLRIDPYYRATARRHPDLAPRFEELIGTSGRRRVALVHGDWSPKNFLVAGDELMAIDFEVIHFGDPSYDAAFLLNHLLLKSYHLPAWRERFRNLALTFRDTLLGELPREWDWFEAATIRHLGCLLLARIDGKSPAEYVTAEHEKETIRAAARELILRPPATIADVFSC